MKVKIIAEIGINHNGSLDLAKKLIDIAAFAGCDYVKFQKRTPDLCVPASQKNRPKKTPWGDMTYLEYKQKLEFGFDEYREIDRYCVNHGIQWFASVWDLPSIDFMRRFTNIIKVPSAMLTNDEVLAACRSAFDTVLLSTGMATEAEIEHAVSIGKPDVIMHTNSSYPARVEELNLLYIAHLRNKYPGVTVGYSGHEFGLLTTFAAAVLGAEWIERHITLDRTMWGSDHLASVEPGGLLKLCHGLRSLEASMGSGDDRTVYPSELDKRASLVGDLEPKLSSS